MDELHAAIAAYLRFHNRRLPDRIELSWSASLRPLGRCRVCADPIVAGDGDAPAYAALLAAGRCLGCYLASEAA